MLELPHGNRAGLILRYDNALCFLVALLSLYDIMPHVAYFIMPHVAYFIMPHVAYFISPWNESRDRGSH